MCLGGVWRVLGSFEVFESPGPALPLGFADLFECGNEWASGGVEVCKISKSAVPLECDTYFLYCSKEWASGSVEVVQAPKR